jgi:hypothetical protein
MQKHSTLTSLVVSLVAGLGAGLFFSAGQARAAETNVAVLGIEAGEGVPESVATAVTDALRQRMSLTSGYRLVQGRDLVEVKLVFSCPDEAPPCMGQAAKSLGAARLLFGTVKKAGAEAYSVTLKLFDGDKEVVESWTSDQFARNHGTSAALRTPAQKWIATLTGQSLPGSLHIQGGVVGAQVSLDEVGIGVISATGLGISGVAAGKHEIVVSKPGYQTVRKTITLASGDNRDLTVEMVAEPRAGVAEGAAATEPAATEQAPASEPTASSSDNRLGTKIAAVSTLVGGLVGIGIGIRYSILVNDANNKLDPYRRFDCVPVSKGPQCDIHNEVAPDISPELRAWMDKTKNSADKYQIYQWVGYGVGGALVITSGYLFYKAFVADSTPFSTSDARGSSLHLAPMISPNGMGAAAFATF